MYTTTFYILYIYIFLALILKNRNDPLVGLSDTESSTVLGYSYYKLQLILHQKL